MKFLTQIITLNKSQYVIQNKPTLWTKLATLLKILLIVCLSLHSGYEHICYVAGRLLKHQFEILAINLMTSLLTPKGRVLLCA